MRSASNLKQNSADYTHLSIYSPPKNAHIPCRSNQNLHKRDTQCCTIWSAFTAQNLWHKICNQTYNTWWHRYVQHAQNCSGSFLCITKKMTNDNSASDIVPILTGWTSSTYSVCSCLSSRHIRKSSRSLNPQYVCARAVSSNSRYGHGTVLTVTAPASQFNLVSAETSPRAPRGGAWRLVRTYPF